MLTHRLEFDTVLLLFTAAAAAAAARQAAAAAASGAYCHSVRLGKPRLWCHTPPCAQRSPRWVGCLQTCNALIQILSVFRVVDTVGFQSMGREEGLRKAWG